MYKNVKDRIALTDCDSDGSSTLCVCQINDRAAAGGLWRASVW